MESKQSVQNQETSGIPEDLRAAMESPEVKAFDARLSKKYLKNNRPKSLVVVILLVGAVLLLLGLSSHKASSVTPAALRTAQSVTACLNGGETFTLSSQQREDLLDLLGQVKVERVTGTIDTSQPEGSCLFTAGEDQFTTTSTGYLLTDSNPYRFLSPEAEEVWQQLTALLAS